MRIKNYSYLKGDLILNIVDKENRFLGNFIVSDSRLVKELRHNDLSKVELVFKYD